MAQIYGYIRTSRQLQEGAPGMAPASQELQLRRAGGGRPVRLVHTPAFLSLALTRLVGLLLRDVVLTRERLTG